MPLDQLKIDQSFVCNVMHDPRDAGMVNTIITLGHTMEMTVIAEGVETAEQGVFLAERGCGSYQGYFFSRPLPWEQLKTLLSCAAPAQGHKGARANLEQARKGRAAGRRKRIRG